MAAGNLSPSLTDRLRRLESVTDTALSHFDTEHMLLELLDRVRELLEADTAAVLLLDQDGSSLVATAARGIEEEVVQGVRIPVGRGFAGRIAAERAPVVLDRVDHTTVLNPILRERGIKSLAGVPLLVRGDVIGVLHVGSLTGRRFSAEEVQLLQLVGDRVAFATQARLRDAEHSAVVVLQNSLLPGRLPTVSGIDSGARYVPGEAGTVGGDWYDVFILPSGALCIVIGDVVGRGVRSAVVMGRLRSALRSYALTVEDPAQILSLVDRKIQHFEPGEMATILVGVLDPSHGRLRISSAGHPAPVLVSPGSAPALLDLAVDAPIGVRYRKLRRVVDVDVARGAVLCLYTDGLVERRGVPLEERLELLLSSVECGSPEDVCARVMMKMVGSETARDDIALLVVRRHDHGGLEPLDIEAVAEPDSLSQIRSSLRRWLSAAGASDALTIDLLLGTGEAAANAIEHAYGAAGGTLEVHAELDGDEVEIRVRDRGQWRAPRGRDRGRGTDIMQRTADEFRVERSSAGTEVVIRKRLRP